MAIPNIDRNNNLIPVITVATVTTIAIAYHASPAIKAAVEVAIAFFSSPPVKEAVSLVTRAVTFNCLLTTPFIAYGMVQPEARSLFHEPVREEVFYRWVILDLIQIGTEACGVEVEVAARIALASSSAFFAVDRIGEGRTLTENVVRTLSSGMMAYLVFGPLYVQFGLIASISAHIFNNVVMDLVEGAVHNYQFHR